MVVSRFAAQVTAVVCASLVGLHMRDSAEDCALTFLPRRPTAFVMHPHPACRPVISSTECLVASSSSSSRSSSSSGLDERAPCIKAAVQQPFRRLATRRPVVMQFRTTTLLVVCACVIGRESQVSACKQQPWRSTITASYCECRRDGNRNQYPNRMRDYTAVWLPGQSNDLLSLGTLPHNL